MTSTTRRRVLCFGFDSPAVSVLQAGLSAGRLPGLAAVLDRGRSVALADLQDILTPPTWLTMLRGCEMSDYGHFADREYVRGGYRIADIPPESPKRPPFWQHLSDAGIPCVILSPYGAPVLDGLLGVQVTGWGSHDPYNAKLGRSRSAPPEVLGELDRLVGPRAIRYDATPPRTARQIRDYTAAMVRGCDQQARALLHLLGRGEWGFALASFGEGHQAGHWLIDGAGSHGVEPDPEAATARDEGLARIYEATDRALTKVVAALPQDTTVLVVSPYDMGPNHHLDEVLPEVLVRSGFLTRTPTQRQSPRVRALRAGRAVVRATVPARLRPALGRVAGRERLLGELVESSIDWSMTSAFPVPTDTSGAVRLNLAGREPQGTVTPGDGVDRTLSELARTLQELRCADTGRPIVVRVARYEELFDVEPCTGPADLFFQWAPMARPRAVQSARIGEVPVPAARFNRGVHSSPGFVIGAGAGITPAGHRRVQGPEQAKVADLAATVLALLDVPVPPEITGRPIPGLVPEAAGAGS